MARVRTQRKTLHSPRKVLMVSCAFPPTGGPGVQRSVKFAKYLPQFGWHPVIWAADSLAGLPRDETLQTDIPSEAVVHRKTYSGMARTIQRSLKSVTACHGLASRFTSAIDWRLDAWLAKTSFPDDFATWAQASIPPLCDLVNQDGIDVVFSTFSPASNHLIGLELKNRTGLPWVADFRDLWTDDYRYRESSPSRRKGHRKLEQEILETADAVIGVTQTQTEILAGHVPNQESKFITIPNGFDPADFEGLRESRQSEKKAFILAHVGRFDEWRTSESLFRALERFTESIPNASTAFCLNIVGHINQRIRNRLETGKIPHTVSEQVPHHVAIQEMVSAEALLLCVPTGQNGNSVIPAKLFEYLAAGRPILVVGPEQGEAQRIVQSTGSGLTVPLHENSIIEGLTKLFEMYLEGRPQAGCSTEQAHPFSRIERTSELAQTFDAVTSAKPKPGRKPARVMENAAR